MSDGGTAVVNTGTLALHPLNGAYETAFDTVPTTSLPTRPGTQSEVGIISRDVKIENTPEGKIIMSPAFGRYCGARALRDLIQTENNNYLYYTRLSEIKTAQGIELMPRRDSEQDTFLDNEVGDTVRYIKNHFGDAPLIKAYDAAIDALEESERRWKEYWEEEARLQSLFEEDEDSVL